MARVRGVKKKRIRSAEEKELNRLYNRLKYHYKKTIHWEYYKEIISISKTRKFFEEYGKLKMELSPNSPKSQRIFQLSKTNALILKDFRERLQMIDKLQSQDKRLFKIYHDIGRTEDKLIVENIERPITEIDGQLYTIKGGGLYEIGQDEKTGEWYMLYEEPWQRYPKS